MKLRAINVWGNSGGTISDVSIDNITGSILAVVAGVWVEDSFTTFSNLTIQMADQGIIVQHLDDQFRTTPYFNDIKIMNATYRGLLVEKSIIKITQIIFQHKLIISKFGVQAPQIQWFPAQGYLPLK